LYWSKCASPGDEKFGEANYDVGILPVNEGADRAPSEYAPILEIRDVKMAACRIDRDSVTPLRITRMNQIKRARADKTDRRRIVKAGLPSSRSAVRIARTAASFAMLMLSPERACRAR